MIPAKTDSAGTPRILVDEYYEHIESFGQAIGWDIDFRQIDPGPLAARVTAYGTNHLTVFRVEFNRSFHQVGRPPSGLLTFGLPDYSSGPLRWNGADTPAGVLINFNYATELDCVNQPGQFGGYVIGLTAEQLALGGHLTGIPGDTFQDLGACRFWSPETGRHENLRELLNSLTEVARREGDAGLCRWHDVFSTDVPVMLAQIVAGDAYLPASRTPGFRAAALRRAIAILDNYDEVPESVESLCQVACCSWDTLKRAFKEEFGLPPKAYLKSRRLAAVQADLVRLGPSAVISDVASQRGFSHMGSFAAAYRKQFGELPSETLKQLKAR